MVGEAGWDGSGGNTGVPLGRSIKLGRVLKPERYYHKDNIRSSSNISSDVWEGDLVVAEGRCGIEAHGAASGNVAGGGGYGDKEQRDGGVRERVEVGDAEEEGGQEA